MLRNVALVLFVGLLSMACSKDPAPGAQNDLKGPPIVVKVGGSDDSIKPAPKTISKVGTADDTIKPAPKPAVGRVGTADDTIRPAASR
ncbi:MAG: hypothetical protein U0270_31165 [Labilithrix sp.]